MNSDIPGMFCSTIVNLKVIGLSCILWEFKKKLKIIIMLMMMVFFLDHFLG